jgi:hypothetical protein
VYFRWSTAFNSKNRFKGIVTDHVSRAASKGQRIDFLTIKTFGISEDRYVMGKDIRELFVFASKTALMLEGTEEEVKQRAVMRWGIKDGWINVEDDSVSTQASTPLITSAAVKSAQKKISEPPTEKQPSKKPVEVKKVRKLTVVKSIVVPQQLDRVHVWTTHGKRTMAARLDRFSFFN